MGISNHRVRAVACSHAVGDQARGVKYLHVRARSKTIASGRVRRAAAFREERGTPETNSALPTRPVSHFSAALLWRMMLHVQLRILLLPRGGEGGAKRRMRGEPQNKTRASMQCASAGRPTFIRSRTATTFSRPCGRRARSMREIPTRNTRALFRAFIRNARSSLLQLMGNLERHSGASGFLC